MLDLLWLGLRLFYDKAKEDACKYDLRKERMELMQMDVWDGIEKQLEDQLAWLKISHNAYDVIVDWKGDPNKRITINRIWLRINRDFWNTGLSVEEYAKQYFRKMFDENPCGSPIWKGLGGQDKKYDFNLYDRNGNTYRVCGDNILLDRFIIYHNKERTTIFLEKPEN